MIYMILFDRDYRFEGLAFIFSLLINIIFVFWARIFQMINLTYNKYVSAPVRKLCRKRSRYLRHGIKVNVNIYKKSHGLCDFMFGRKVFSHNILDYPLLVSLVAHCFKLYSN